MSRSCQRATFSTRGRGVAAQHARQPGDALGGDRVALVGHRARALLRPARNGSSASRTSVRCRWRTSVARRSRPAPASAMACSSSAWRSRGTTCVETASRSSPRRRQHALLELRARGRVGADRAADRPDARLREGALQALGVAVRLEGEARELEAEGRRLGVDAVGAPDADGVGVLARPRGQRAPRARARPPTTISPAACSCRASAVSRTSEEVSPKWIQRPPGPALCLQHVDEGRHVVVGHALALLDRLDGERRAADRLEVGLGRALHLLARRHLDAPPRLHARLVGPDAPRAPGAV